MQMRNFNLMVGASYTGWLTSLWLERDFITRMTCSCRRCCCIVFCVLRLMHAAGMPRSFQLPNAAMILEYIPDHLVLFKQVSGSRVWTCPDIRTQQMLQQGSCPSQRHVLGLCNTPGSACDKQNINGLGQNENGQQKLRWGCDGDVTGEYIMKFSCHITSTCTVSSS